MATNQQNTTINIDEQLKAAQLRRLLREEQQEQEAFEAAEKRKKSREAQNRLEVEDARRQALEKKHRQDNCPHCAKDVSFVRGQWLGNTKDEKGNMVRGFLAFCQICLKEFRSIDEIPMHLRSDNEYFGGPKNY